MQTIKLVGANNYHRAGQSYKRGELYQVTDDKADELLSIEDEVTGVTYFAEATRTDLVKHEQAKARAARAAALGAEDDDLGDDEPVKPARGQRGNRQPGKASKPAKELEKAGIEDDTTGKGEAVTV